jgi:predicted dehydrogenase
VVGAGIGTQHIDAYRELAERFEVVAFCDLDPARAAEVAERYKIAQAMTALDDLLALPEVEIVDLCTPSNLHVGQTEAALLAGKHVVCEKPLAGSLAAVDELAALERETGRRICPIFQYRFGNGLRRLLHLRDKGVLGRLYLATVETHWRRLPAYYAVPWRGRWATELGGCLVTHAIHAHDMLTHVLGPVASVHARTATRVNAIETEDCAVLSLAMADGGLAALSVTLGAMSEHSRLRFYFEQAAVESCLAAYRPHLEPWQIEPRSEAAADAIAAALADFEPAPEHYLGQFTELHDALTGGSPLPVTVADARRSIELFTAAYHSTATGTEVALPIGPDHPAYHGGQPRAARSDG